METRTVKLPKALPNTLRKVKPRFVVTTKLSQGKKDLGNPFVLWGFFSTATSRNTWAHQMRPPFSAQPAQPPPRTNGASVFFFSTLFMLLY